MAESMASWERRGGFLVEGVGNMHARLPEEAGEKKVLACRVAST